MEDLFIDILKISKRQSYMQSGARVQSSLARAWTIYVIKFLFQYNWRHSCTIWHLDLSIRRIRYVDAWYEPRLGADCGINPYRIVHRRSWMVSRPSWRRQKQAQSGFTPVCPRKFPSSTVSIHTNPKHSEYWQPNIQVVILEHLVSSLDSAESMIPIYIQIQR